MTYSHWRHTDLLILHFKCYNQKNPGYSGNMAERVMVTKKGVPNENAFAVPALKIRQGHARCREGMSRNYGNLIASMGLSKQSWGTRHLSEGAAVTILQGFQAMLRSQGFIP